jgi:predicted outer membrane repeat protein
LLIHSLRLVLLAGIVLFNPAAYADICTLNPLVANPGDGGDGSLRQAIGDACANSTIKFVGDMTITLTSGELVIGKNLTIDGVGHSVTVSGNNASRVLYVIDGSFMLQNLTVTGGNALAGGGLYIDNSLGSPTATINNVTISGNTASLTGGGIDNHAIAILTNVTFSSNSASIGGGMYAGGNVTLTNVTFSGNSATSSGGGLATSGSGTLTNVTISGNSASSGAAGIEKRDSHITRLTNTLLAGNSGANCSGNPFIRNSANNLDDGETCRFGSANGSLSNTDPLLGTLGNYGGPTQTIPLLAGSPAINAGTNTGCPATDQRGVPRPQGKACDIGAFEFVFPKSSGLGPAWNNDWLILRQP